MKRNSLTRPTNILDIISKFHSRNEPSLYVDITQARAGYTCSLFSSMWIIRCIVFITTIHCVTCRRHIQSLKVHLAIWNYELKRRGVTIKSSQLIKHEYYWSCTIGHCTKHHSNAGKTCDRTERLYLQGSELKNIGIRWKQCTFVALRTK